MSMKNSPLRLSEIVRVARVTLGLHHHGAGLLTLVAALFCLALLAGLQSPVQTRLYAAGEIASADVVAHRNLTVEDVQATQARKARVAEAQPTVFDLSNTEINALRERVFSVIKRLNESGGTGPAGFALPEGGAVGEAGRVEELSRRFSEELGSPVEMTDVEQWLRPGVQEFILGTALPWLEQFLAEGVVADARQVLASPSGILVRDMETRQEALRPDNATVRDIPALLAMFSQMTAARSGLTYEGRRAVAALFSPLIMPTLTLNREATLSLGEAMAQTVKPVYYDIQRGEVIVYQGERVTREKQLKLQSLFRKAESFIQFRTVAGSFLLSLVFAIGLFMAPSGKPATPLRCKDFLFISLLLLLFGALARGSYFLGGQLMDLQQVTLASYAFPAAGAAGLSALIFAARRYCVVGLFLSLFCTLMFKGGLPLFLFFYLSSMLNTWLVIRAQNRQDVVLSLVPLSIGMACIAAGAGWLEGLRGGEAFLILMGNAVLGAVISLFLLFALSPVLELLFDYTTRFRLMELMNLEQPLLQDLMVTIPGTYHHSLVVANMVEAGAKSVGANSLLCKVAALYHDIGKLAYPDYFIENQFNGPNRHDRLAPNMSALILSSHVKKGVELARRHRLGNEIEDIIRQHHGSGLMRFFYKKALDMGETPSREEYSYPGPRPQTREAAIVMLADAVEASSRTLSEPTPARIKTHIDTIIKDIFADGQLDESELTFKDLHKLAESFVRILTGLFHQRIAYPDLSKDKKVEARVETPAAEIDKGGPVPVCARSGVAGRFVPDKIAPLVSGSGV